MHQTMIIAKMAPADAEDVAAVFGRYDATSMPHEIGVRHRSLFQFHGIYVHLLPEHGVVPDVDGLGRHGPRRCERAHETSR